jgi:SMODS and SLOG-associating 2TM effector domain 2
MLTGTLPQEGNAAAPRGKGRAFRRLRWRRGDIEPIGSPSISQEDWNQPAVALERMREWAEGHAAITIRWYLRDKQPKRWASRVLRAVAVVLATAGGIFPLLAAGPGGPDASVGYILLAAAAGCVAFDHFFGLSSGWMRDVLTSQSLQSRLARFQMAWAMWQAEEGSLNDVRPARVETSNRARVALELVDGLITDVLQITNDETTQWAADFNSSMAALRREAARSGSPSSESRSGSIGGPRV